MRKWIINWLINQVVSAEGVGMSKEEQYGILLQVKQVEKFDKLLRALISSEVMDYFSIPEEEKEARWVKKGSVLRLRWFRIEMDRAKEKLESLSKEKTHD